MLGPIAIDKSGLLTLLWERRFTIDPDLIAVCLFADLRLTAALTLASLWRTSAEAWLDALAN